eukprot:gene860-29741_t
MKILAVVVVGSLCHYSASYSPPTASSNYGVYTGTVAYLDSYVANNPRVPYGIINGKVMMARISTTPKTTLSISLYVERMQKISIEALQRNKLYGYVFDRPCEQHGSSKRLQDPYICGDDGGRCSDEEVTAWEGISPLEYYVELRSQRTGSSAAATSSATAEFGVHLPLELLARSSLSVVIYDPFTQSPMVCATLGNDRDIDGFTYRANDQLVDTRPLVNLKITREETGNSEISYSISGLKTETVYPTRLHALPCLAGGDSVSPGPAYYRDPTCNDNGSTNADVCGNTETAQVWLGHLTSKFGAIVGKKTIPNLLRADAQSVVIHTCASSGAPPNPDTVPDGTGLCESGMMSAAVCIDLLNDMPDLLTTAAPPEATESTVAGTTTDTASAALLASTTETSDHSSSTPGTISAATSSTTTTDAPSDETTIGDPRTTYTYKCTSNVAIVGKADVPLPSGDDFVLSKTKEQCANFCNKNDRCAAYVFQLDDGLEYQHMDGYCELWSIAGLQVAPNPHNGAEVCIKLAMGDTTTSLSASSSASEDSTTTWTSFSATALLSTTEAAETSTASDTDGHKVSPTTTAAAERTTEGGRQSTSSDADGHKVPPTTTTVASSTKLAVDDNRETGDGGTAPSSQLDAQQCPSMKYQAYRQLWSPPPKQPRREHKDKNKNGNDNDNESGRSRRAQKDKKGPKIQQLDSVSKSAKAGFSPFSHDLSSVQTDNGDAACCLPETLPTGAMSFYVANSGAGGSGGTSSQHLRNVSVAAAACVILMAGFILLAVQRQTQVSFGMKGEYRPKLWMGEPAERQHQRLLSMPPGIHEYAIPCEHKQEQNGGSRLLNREPRGGDATARILEDRYAAMHTGSGSFQSRVSNAISCIYETDSARQVFDDHIDPSRLLSNAAISWPTDVVKACSNLVTYGYI